MAIPSAGPSRGPTLSAGRLPDFLIIGAQRCGTTSLARNLSAHPEVYVASQKEVHFFDRHTDRGLTWYREQFAGASEKQIVGEATPEYMYDKDALRRMAETLPDARLVVSLRNPIDRAYSEYWFVRGRGYESLSFEEAIAAESDRAASGDPVVRMRHSYLDRGRYLQQLERVCELYPRDRLHVVLFEDFVGAPLEALQAVHRFLGVREDFLPSTIGRRFGSARTYKSQWLRAVSKALPYPLGAAVARINSQRVAYPPMESKTRAALEAEFRESNQALAHWLGRDLSRWDGLASSSVS